MTRQAARAAAALLAAAALAVGLPCAAQEKEDLRELRARLEKLRKDLAASEDARSDAVEELREIETAISESGRALRELAFELAATRASLREIESRARLARNSLESREADVARLLRARYVAGDRSALRLVLSGEHPAEAARLLVYHGNLARAQTSAMAAVQADLLRLDGLEREARAKAEALAAAEARSQAERRHLEGKAAERRHVLARISGQIERQRREFKTTQANEARLARIVEALGRTPPPTRPRGGLRNDRIPEAGDPGTGFAGQKGRLRLPVRGELAGRFGTPRQGAATSWKGLFISAPAGAEILAVAAGRVVFAEWMRGYGNLLILDHGEGYLTIYGNNESLLKRLGDAVHAGETVATAGATGGSDASGLYFEIRHEGRPVDPLPWVSLR